MTVKVVCWNLPHLSKSPWEWAQEFELLLTHILDRLCPSSLRGVCDPSLNITNYNDYNPLNLHSKDPRALSMNIATTFWVPSICLGYARCCASLISLISHKYAVGCLSFSSFYRTSSQGIEQLLNLEPGFSVLFSPGHAEKKKKVLLFSSPEMLLWWQEGRLQANHLDLVDQQSGLLIKLFSSLPLPLFSSFLS